MRTFRQTALLLLFTLVATGAAAQVRGEGRVAGKVVDEEGQPLQDVQVKATMTGQTQPMQAKSNKKGELTVNGLAGGEWDDRVQQGRLRPAGRQSHRRTKTAASPDITVKLAKHVERVDPAVELNAKAQEGWPCCRGRSTPRPGRSSRTCSRSTRTSSS